MKILITGLSSFLGTKFLNLFDDEFHFLNICRTEFKDDAHRVSNIMFNDLEIENLSRECNVPFNGIRINYQSIKRLFNQNSYSYTNENIILSLHKIKSNYINLQ